jgi:hypothetical protein
MKCEFLIKHSLILGLISLSVVLFAQEQNDKTKLLGYLKNIEELNDIDESVVEKTFVSTDVPVLYDIALDIDNTIEYRTREMAIDVALFLNPSQFQLDRIIHHMFERLPSYKRGIDEDNIVHPIRNSIVRNYLRHKNDDILIDLRTFYDDSRCITEECKVFILTILSETDSVKNISLYNKILHDKMSSESLQSLAVYGLAKTGSLEAIPYLQTMANYLFDTERIPSHGTQHVMAIMLLRELGLKHYRASEVLQEIITKLCDYDPDVYKAVYNVPAYVEDIFNALQHHSGEGNRKYLENILFNKCKYEKVLTQSIKTLGYLGDMGTIDILNQYIDIYPKQVNAAIKQIQNRSAQIDNAGPLY